MGNALYWQAGGPTQVINASASGFVERARGRFERVFGAKYALDGVLNEELYDLSDLTESGQVNWKRIERTPSSACGASRKEFYKQLEKGNTIAVDRFFQVLNAWNITYVFPNGGGDTQDTAIAIAREAKERKLSIKVVGIPKTIDNDLFGTDHSPGYGSAATFVANTIVGNYLDARALRHVKIDIVMGRVAGWLTASAILARKSGKGIDPLIFVPEQHSSIEQMVGEIEEMKRKQGFAYAAVSEGYGHIFVGNDKTRLAAGFELETFLAKNIMSWMGVEPRVDKYGYPQRSSPLARSKQDFLEAKLVGSEAVKIAFDSKVDYPSMVSIERISDNPYEFRIVPVHLDEVAAPEKGKLEKIMPVEFAGTSGHINDSFLDYVEPLAGRIEKVGEIFGEKTVTIKANS